MNRTHKILAPMSGRLTPLQQVPDQIFSQGLLGEGIAILPEDGRILAPVDGVISAVMDTLHAYGFETEDGLELLVHVGLGSLTLRGEAFRCYVNIGQQVKAGDMIAEVDLKLLEENGIPAITPVVICEGGDGLARNMAEGSVIAGQTTLMTLTPRE